ncbi:MAG: hypothetical protein CMQ33_08605 [Gammaproteobacteria bacterium]|nr:hypothetical protein [Gammaproteobacteria bacterium]
MAQGYYEYDNIKVAARFVTEGILMRTLVFCASLLLSTACFAPHYTTWGGSSYDLKQVEQIRGILASIPVKQLHRLTPTRQVEGIRSWLAYGPGKSIFVKLNIGRPASSSELVFDIARDLGIDVKADVFMAAVKSHAWDRAPIDPTKRGSGTQARPWWQKPSPTKTKTRGKDSRIR